MLYNYIVIFTNYIAVFTVISLKNILVSAVTCF